MAIITNRSLSNDEVAIKTNGSLSNDEVAIITSAPHRSKCFTWGENGKLGSSRATGAGGQMIDVATPAPCQLDRNPEL